MKIETLTTEMLEKQEKVKHLEQALHLFKGNKKANLENIRLISYEIFFIKDQLKKYNTISKILKDDNLALK